MATKFLFRSLLPFLLGWWLLPPGSLAETKDFNVYWNVPTFMCDHRGIFINASKFGIIQNEGDDFQGDKVTIWYTAGKFPYLKDGEAVNGGIPQKGNLDDHVATFKSQVDTMPQDFNGVAVLDFESYLPSLLNAPKEYKTASHDWVASQHPTWTEEEIEEESYNTFNESIREFMEILPKIGSEMRPNGIWGYYHYPYCKNHQGVVECGQKTSEMNDDTLWIYEASGAMYPSIYLIKGDSVEGRINMVVGRIEESMRLNDKLSSPIDIFTYCWYRYHETPDFITAEDIVNTIALSKESGIQGAVMWGSSGDLDTDDKCNAFKDYFENIMGPLIEEILDLPEDHLSEITRSRDMTQHFIAKVLRARGGGGGGGGGGSR